MNDLQPTYAGPLERCGICGIDKCVHAVAAFAALLDERDKLKRQLAERWRMIEDRCAELALSNIANAKLVADAERMKKYERYFERLLEAADALNDWLVANPKFDIPDSVYVPFDDALFNPENDPELEDGNEAGAPSESADAHPDLHD